VTAKADSTSRQFPWLPVLLILAAIALATLWFPTIRTFAHFEINLNEGWNAYRAKMAAAGLPLYAAPPRFTITNYPPISFHFIGFLGRLNNDVVAAGRYVSLVSVILIALLIAAIVKRLAGHWRAGVYAALSFVIWLAIFQPDRIGMDDPQLFATVFSLAGLYAYLARPDSTRWLCASAIFFIVGLFSKHNLLAFPLAVGIHLVLTGAWKPFAIWTATCAAAAAALLFITLHIDGPYLVANVTAPRPYSVADAFSLINRYRRTFQIPAAAALAWSCWNFANPSRNILVIALVLAHAIAFAFSGGYGVDGNIFFDSIIVLAMIAGVAAHDVVEMFQSRRSASAFLTVLLLVPMLGVLPALPARIARDSRDYSALPESEEDFAQTVDFLAASPGPALCNDLLLCFEAGKAEEFDSFQVASQLGVGKLDEREIGTLIDKHYFNTMQFGVRGDGLVSPAKPLRGLMAMVLAHYRLGLRAGEYGVMIPNVD
jgi:Dolichyl-phosphate-mannose-protein mannosyltransferase